MGKSLQRPYRFDQLNLKDIKKGVRVTIHNASGRPSGTFTLVSDPYLHDRTVLMIMLEPASGGAGNWIEYSLADLGVVPYDNGWWNTTTYITQAE